jgi:hypothetical protein
MYLIEPCLKPDPKDDVWLEYLAQDPAYLHCILFITQAYFDYLYGSGFGRETIMHLSNTLRLLQNNLENPHMAVADSTISVVYLLTMVANRLGDNETALQHAKGLYKMIMMRGGLDKLREYSYLQIKACR